MLAVFEHYHIHVQELAPRTHRVGSAGVLADRFPGLPADGFSMTCDRARALVREDVQFLTWDHPLVTGALDFVLGSETGNSSFAWWPDPDVEGFYLEAVYVLESIAPLHLHIDRFLPPTPLRVLVDQRGNEISDTPVLEESDAYELLANPELRSGMLPELIRRSEAIGHSRAPEIIARARTEMNDLLEREIRRLMELREVNTSVPAAEIEALVNQQRELDQSLQAARLRLDAIRLIVRGPGDGVDL